MRSWSPERIAQESGARLLSGPPSGAGPERATIDSRQAGPGVLFVGLNGVNVDGGTFAPQALAAGAWGILAKPEHAEAARCAQLDDSGAARESEAGGRAGRQSQGALLAAEDPLRALQRLATAWRRELGAKVIGVTGSTGKTSTKDIMLALLAPHRRTVASRANFNTEIGLPLEILDAPAGTEVLVLEMGMRGAGQIAELAAIAEPDVAVIVSVGPVHLELLGTIEAVAAAKAELIAALHPGGTAVVPAGEQLLVPHLRDDLDTITFGAGGDVQLRTADRERLLIDVRGDSVELEVPFAQPHLRTNLLAAVAAARAVDVNPGGRVELALSPGRGQRVSLADGVTLIDDCYNANPISMRAALDDLVATTGARPSARRLAVLGDMLELGPDERQFHEQLGEHAQAVGLDVLVTVGPLAAAIADRFDGESYPLADAGEAAALVPELLEPEDVVLVKGSRGVGLELVCQALGGRE
jgi:UDP-N-acetylmuramoyl-tripeptide--D-alanyl-D-alanine ligase